MMQRQEYGLGRPQNKTKQEFYYYLWDYGVGVGRMDSGI